MCRQMSRGDVVVTGDPAQLEVLRKMANLVLEYALKNQNDLGYPFRKREADRATKWYVVQGCSGYTALRILQNNTVLFEDLMSYSGTHRDGALVMLLHMLEPFGSVPSAFYRMFQFNDEYNIVPGEFNTMLINREYKKHYAQIISRGEYHFRPRKS